jgi:hypothetical protein
MLQGIDQSKAMTTRSLKRSKVSAINDTDRRRSKAINDEKPIAGRRRGTEIQIAQGIFQVQVQAVRRNSETIELEFVELQLETDARSQKKSVRLLVHHQPGTLAPISNTKHC